MVSAITKGIKVSVRPRFEAEHSRPAEGKYVFSYNIRIENVGSDTVQLLRRNWIIKDSILIIREVQGEGVIGQQPIIAPGETYEYSSWCPLNSEIGKMSGHFTMTKQSGDHTFDVSVPPFILCSTARLN